MLVLDVVVDAARPGEGVVGLVGEPGVGTAGDGHAQVTGLDGTLAAAFDQAGEAGRAAEPGEVGVVVDAGLALALGDRPRRLAPLGGGISALAVLHGAHGGALLALIFRVADHAAAPASMSSAGSTPRMSESSSRTARLLAWKVA